MPSSERDGYAVRYVYSEFRVAYGRKQKTRATAHSLSLCAHSLPVGFYRRRMTDDANVCSPHSHLFVEKGFIIDVSMCVTCDGRWEMGEIRWMLDGVQVRLDWISQYRYDQKLSHGEMIAQSTIINHRSSIMRSTYNIYIYICQCYFY